MKPTTLDIKRTGDLGGQQIAMGIDASAMGHVMNILTDLYSNPKLAVIREYSTNARDAHIAAGIPDVPIHVTTPNALSPYFTVKDYGPGLSVKDIEEIYSKYGASTKRGGNDQVGMLGLGCKSGLTYTSQFNVTAIQDGMKAVVTVFRLEDGTGTMNIVTHEPTDEVNSVEISVPTKKNDDFLYPCNEFFKYWAPGTVLLNGKEPKRFSGDKISPRLTIVDSTTVDHVVMGGVAYPVKDGLSGTDVYKSWGIVAEIGIGDVNFTPSREDLHYTGRTKDCLAELRAEFKENAIKTVQTDIASAKTYREAIERYQRWFARFGKLIDTAKYNGQIIETSWEMPTYKTGQKDYYGKDEIKQQSFISYRVGYGRGSVNKHNRTVKFDSVKDVLCVINYPFGDLATSRRAKIKDYMAANNMTYNVVWFFPEDVPGGVWTSNVAKLEYETLKAFRVPSVGGKRYASGYRFQVAENGTWKDTDELDDTRPIVYFSTADLKDYDMRGVFKAFPDVQCVKLTRNRWEKFNRDFPTGVTVQQWAVDTFNTAFDSLTEADQIKTWMDSSGHREVFKRIDISRVSDPEIIKYAKAAHEITISPTMGGFKKAQHAVHNIDRYAATKAVKVANPLDNYPLLRASTYDFKFTDDAYLYMEAKYRLTNPLPVKYRLTNPLPAATV